LVTASCSYPEFGFAPDAALPDSGDSALVDSAPVDSALDDSALDTIVADGVVPETTITDTFVSDTFVPDTFVPDTFVPDTAPPKTGCAVMLHDFCADWDTSSPEPTFGWGSSYLQNGGTIAHDTVNFSPPRSLLTTVPAGSGVGAASVSRELPAPAATTMARIDVRIRLDVDKYSPGVLLVKLQRENHGAAVWLGPTGLYLEAFGNTYRAADFTKKVVPGTWHRLRMEATIRTTGATIRGYLDDLSTPAATLTDVSTAISDGTSRSLVIGPYMDGTSYPTFTARYDDASLDWL
jgi:hypothetical protein